MLNKGTILDASGFPCNSGYATLKNIGDALSAVELIRLAQEHPPEPIIRGLLNNGDILLLHGSEESFKSVFILQIAESLAKATSLLNYWGVPHARRVGVIETEMHEVMLGERLGKMFPKGGAPENLLFMPESTMREWRGQDLTHKFESIQQWVARNNLEVLMIDTANDFFRGQQSSSDERHVGEFFDKLRNLSVGTRIIVRHDRKKSQDPNARIESRSNESIRGSGEWKEDPEAIIALERRDRRTNEVVLEVGKLRYGTKPDPCTLWFDAGTFRLTALPPVIAVLSDLDRKSREEIIAQCKDRFGLGQHKVDEMLKGEAAFLTETMNGHSKQFEIDLDKVEQAGWCQFLLGG
jgi:archaellum biogenesis ATPase FlaH